MRVLILGGDGYLGWPTAMRFSGKGHDVAVVDNFARRRWHEQAGTDSLTPIGSLDGRGGGEGRDRPEPGAVAEAAPGQMVVGVPGVEAELLGACPRRTAALVPAAVREDHGAQTQTPRTERMRPAVFHVKQ